MRSPLEATISRMRADAQLKQVLAKYSVNTTGVQTQVRAMYPLLEKWGNGHLLEATWSGSFAKGTAVSISSDADVFLSISSSLTDPLEKIYNSLYNALNCAGYQTIKQNVSVGVRANSYKIDFVPGQRQSPSGYDHSLYKSKTGGWTKTNVKCHVKHVHDSGRLQEIKLTKIWRELNKLDFPSFYLELAVIDHLKGTRSTSLSDNFFSVLGFFATDFQTRRYTDPANTQNIISDDLTAKEKALIRESSLLSRSRRIWGEILW